MSSRGAGFNPLGSSSVLSGGVTEDSKRGIVIKTTGLGEVLSWRNLGPIFSHGADLKGGVLLRTKVAASTPVHVEVLNRKGGVLHRMEFRSKKVACCFRMMRETLTAWVEQFEAGRKESNLYYLIPPEAIIWHGDLFERVWAWERFFPVDDPIYLEEYYRRNAKAIGRQQASFDILALVYPHREKKVTSCTQSDATTQQQEACSADGDDYLIATLVNLCCDKEAELAYEWMKQGLGAASEIRLSIRIQEKGLSFMLQKGDRPIIPDVIHDCLKCIMKEAELILERLKKGLDSNHKLSHRIRTQAFRLVEKYLRADPCSASVATRAILLGATKEADLICKKLRKEGSVSMSENAMSRTIRSSALDMLRRGMDKYELKRARNAGFCYRHHLDLTVTDIATCHKKEHGDVKAREKGLGKVHPSSSRELNKVKYSTKNKLGENLIVYDLTDGAWREDLYPEWTNIKGIKRNREMLKLS